MQYSEHHATTPVTRQDSIKVDEFRKWLTSVIPVHLIPDDLRLTLQENGNHRLDMARRQGVSITEVYFGEDCLPTWPSMCWDPEQQSLHDIIQERLSEIQPVMEFGHLLQQDIQVKCSLRLQEAQNQGIELNDVFIGPSLLPAWDMTPNPTQTFNTSSVTLSAGESHDTGDKQESPATASSMGEGYLDAMPTDKYHCVGKTHDEKSDRIAETVENVVLKPFNSGSGNFLPKTVLGSRDASCSYEEEEEDASTNTDDTDNEDTKIHLNNPVSSQPIYDEHGRSNIIGDVEIVGVPRQFANCDLEVYLALDDDEEYEGLPEVELAIDKEAYEKLYGDHGAIDIHIPGAELFCFGEIEESDNEPNSNSDTVRHLDSQNEDDDMSSVNERDNDEHRGVLCETERDLNLVSSSEVSSEE